MKTIPCPRCGSTHPRQFQTTTGICTNIVSCNRRRCERRIAEDRKRGGKQCMCTTGETTIVFCMLREGHKGLHCSGTKEWSGNYTHPVAAAFVAR